MGRCWKPGPRTRVSGHGSDDDFRGQPRSNETHEPTTDPGARLARKGKGKEAKLSYQANALMENRNGLLMGGTFATPRARRSVTARYG